jgi:DMSO/TMAO reductase YedYZ heme-binding membrane subunit
MRSELWWYVARSGGVVAWALSAASVVWGLVLSSRVFGKRISLPKLLDLHRFLGGLSVVFLAVHLIGLALDDKVTFGLAELLVPMKSSWRPGAVAWGIVAFYLLVAVEITSLLHARIGERIWRSVHYGGFAVFLLATIHGLKAGTDVRNPVIWWPAAIASAAIIGLCAHRILSPGDPVRVAPHSERMPTTAILERTLSELERLELPADARFEQFDEIVPPTPAPAPRADAPIIVEPLFHPLDEPPATATPPEPVVVAPEPEPAPMFPSLFAPATEPPDAGPATEELPPIEIPPAVADAPPVEGLRPPPESPAERVLPTRTPRRVSPTTAPAASVSAWRPASLPTVQRSGPPPPPDAVDPDTGEPDPLIYRKWLRDWLDYVESQP